MFNHYCCCIIKIPVDLTNPGGPWILKLDSRSFPNPELKPEAIESCRKRARLLRKYYMTSHAFTQHENFQIEPVIIKGIPEEDLR